MLSYMEGLLEKYFNPETIQEIAINNVNEQLDAIEKNIEDLQKDIEETRNTPSRYFDISL